MPNKNIDLSTISRQELLNLRICDLPLTLKNTWLADCIDELYRELDNKGIQFKPSCYLADEWLAPDQEPVVGIPFFLAHPTLVNLEREIMLEVEGGTPAGCMKLLRHEAGHAINYAYRFYKTKKWRKTFGQFSKEYTETYRFRPYSKSFVRHLEEYYAQYHPDEDFAETFAVWLTPDSRWEQTYKGWKALHKLRYVESVMNKEKAKRPAKTRGKKYWRCSSLKVTLKNYYKKKRDFGAEDFPDFHDSNLKKIFAEQHRNLFASPAAELIANQKKHIIRCMRVWTGEKKYITAQLLNTIEKRCRVLHLVVTTSENAAVAEITAYLAALVMNYSYTGRFRSKRLVQNTNIHE